MARYFECTYCKCIFLGVVRKDRIKRYCSKQCSNNGKVKIKKIKKCLTCFKKFTLPTNQPKRKFCSVKCIRYSGNRSRLGLYKGFWIFLNDNERMAYIRKQFEKTVIKTDNCWGWKKAPLKTGYGALYIGQKRFSSAHRISWLLHRGDIPKGLFVCHKCDNRICTNPDHLFIGTHLDNMRDMVSKNRQYRRSISCHPM
jgi:hypothetical protein